MDDIVKAAMAKWPNVPRCTGWLALDARGDWYMRDERTQAAGPFPTPKGSRIDHDKLRAFIGRNYAADAQGRWTFQNGPQRVDVTLEVTPWVWRLRARPDAAPALVAHTGEPVDDADVHAPPMVDADGRLYLATARGLGLVHTQDMAIAADAIEAGHWAPEPVDAATLPARFGYVRDPAAAPTAG